MPKPKPLRVHKDFPKTQDTDIVVQSSDRVLFHLHRKNLEVHTEAFPGAEFVAPEGEVTNLSERGDVLAIVFGFVYPRKQPDLEDMGYELLGPVAEAVEKYRVFSAMYPCMVRLRALVPEYPTQILLHGIKHDYPKLIDQAVPYIAQKGLAEVAQMLPPAYLLPWCKYKEAWDNVFAAVLKYALQVDGDLKSPAFGQPHSAYYDYNGGAIEDFSPRPDVKARVEKVLEWKAKDTLSTLLSCLDKEEETSSGSFGLLAMFCREQIDLIPPFRSLL